MRSLVFRAACRRLLTTLMAIGLAYTVGSNAALAQSSDVQTALPMPANPIASPDFAFPPVTPGGLPPTPMQVGTGQPFWVVGPYGSFRVAPPGDRTGSYGNFVWNNEVQSRWMEFSYRTSTVYVYRLQWLPGTYFAFQVCPPYKVWVSNGGAAWQLYQPASSVLLGP
jgi:hypothetical protein